MTEDTIAAQKTATVQAVIRIDGTGTLVLNGQDISRYTRGLHMTNRPNELPRVVIEAVADWSYEGDAAVTVVQSSSEPAAWESAAAEWLASLDMVGVQRRAFENTTDMATSPGEFVRDQLIRELKSRG